MGRSIYRGDTFYVAMYHRVMGNILGVKIIGIGPTREDRRWWVSSSLTGRSYLTGAGAVYSKA